MAQKTNGQGATAGEEQALIVYIRLSDEGSGGSDERKKIFQLEDQVIEAVDHSHAGEYDGNEIGGGFFTMYMYGSSVARLWEVTSPVIAAFHAPSGSYAIKRYGKPGAKEDRLPL